MLALEERNRKYLKVARHTELTGSDRFIYHLLEIMPGFLSWGTIIGVILLSAFRPVWAAIFIIIFDVYWLIKTAFLSLHLRANWKRMKKNIKIDWGQRLENLKYDHIWQMVVLPMYKETYEVVEETMEGLLQNNWSNEKMIVSFSYEERAGQDAAETARRIYEQYKGKFGHFLFTMHPQGIEGELAGKGANITWAARKTKEDVLDRYNIPHEDVLVSAFDIDTRVYPQYFECLTWHFLTAENPLRSSFQPVPVFNNNIWEAPALSRVVATSATFWQMIQQERPERLSTFSSHAVPFKTLHEIDYWAVNMVSDDSRIFWNALLHFNGDYSVVPISYPVSMDANLAPKFLQTIKNVYKQQRRWTWGVENIPYLLFGFIKNKSISWTKKFKFTFVQVEGFWALATNPILIFLLGWLPLVLGGADFNTTLLSYNLPRITKILMNTAMLGLIGSAIVSYMLLPPRPKTQKKSKCFFMIIQWILVPITILFFGAVPGLDSQTRLMFGRYMGFWVTPKHRIKDNNQDN